MSVFVGGVYILKRTVKTRALFQSGGIVVFGDVGSGSREMLWFSLVSQ